MNQFLHAHGWEIARLTFEHLWLTLSAMLLATGIGLPLGILLTRRAPRKTRHRGRKYHPNGPQPRPLRPASPRPMAWRERCATGDPRTHRLRTASHPAQHICRNPQCRSGARGRGRSPGYDLMAAPHEGRTASRGERDPGRPADCDRNVRWGSHHCRGNRRRRPWRTHLPRRRQRRQLARPRRRNPRRPPSPRRRRHPRLARTQGSGPPIK